jgi:N-acyl-D-amino-acid deacylase
MKRGALLVGTQRLIVGPNLVHWSSRRVNSMSVSFEIMMSRALRRWPRTITFAAAILLSAALPHLPADAQASTYDLVLRNARIIDGSGKPAYRGDVAIRGDTIVRIARSITDPDVRAIDVGSQVVAPGFIDVHNHGRVGIFRLPTADNLVRQGVTTAIEGPDGISPVPLAPFLERLAALQKSINIGTFIGHGSVRERVMGKINRQAVPEELGQMRSLVEQGMKDGAFGLSSGLIYVPGKFAPTSELVELAKVVGGLGGHYQSHIRDEGSRIVEAVQEAIAIGEQAGLPTQITHHKAVAPPNWGKSIDTLRLISAARARGVDVTIDQYPYASTGASFPTYIPSWAQEGGLDATRNRLKDVDLRAKIKAHTIRVLRFGASSGDLTKIALARCAWDKTLAGKTLADVVRMRGDDVTVDNGAEAVFWILEKGGCEAVVRDSLSEKDIERILKHPATMVASDGNIPGPTGDIASGVPHPRSYGTFPRVLGYYVRERKVLKLEEAVYKMTSFPARRLGLHDRGLIREGMKADIVVFDPARVRDTGTLENPKQYPEGIPIVIVNGEIVVEGGATTAARPGRVLYGPAAGSKPKS